MTCFRKLQISVLSPEKNAYFGRIFVFLSVNFEPFVNTRLFPGASKMSLDLIVCVAALSLRYGIASPDLKICHKKRKANEILTGGVSASTRYGIITFIAQNVDSHRDSLP